MRSPILWLAAGVVLLLLADALAFHDVFEPHTVRDWMMLLASGLVVIGLTRELAVARTTRRSR
jgi:drug/metabolite transporter (DMT)-like permease